MATIISKQATSLAGTNGFYRVEAANFGVDSFSILLISGKYQNVTFANAGNCQGIVLCVGSNDSMTRGLTVVLEQYQSITSVDAATDTFTKNSHGLVDGDKITITATSMPGGTATAFQYFVVNAALNTFQISTSLGGGAVNISSSGSAVVVGVERASKTQTAAEIFGDNYVAGHAAANTGNVYTAFKFASPYAVTNAASTWRFFFLQGAGSGTWRALQSSTNNPFYVTWCDNVLSYSDGDVIVVDYEVRVDKTTTLGTLTGTGGSLLNSVCILGQPTTPGKQDVSRLRWAAVPTAAYTLTCPGNILMGDWSGVSIGEEHSATVTITNANPGVVTHGTHGLLDDQMVFLRSTGTLPTGLSASIGYYYYVETIDAGSYYLLDAPGGSRIDTTGTQSGTHTLYWGHIPIAQKATVAFTGSSVNCGFYVGSSGYTTSYNGTATILSYGQVPKYLTAEIASTANTGQKNIVTVESVNWVNGQTIAVGGADVIGQGDTTLYTVDSVVGTTVTVTANVATNNRVAGGHCVLIGGCGVQITGTTASYRVTRFANIANLNMHGTDFVNIFTSSYSTTYFANILAVKPTLRSGWVIEDGTVYFDSNQAVSFLQPIIPSDGITVSRLHSFREYQFGTTINYAVAGYNSGTLTFEDSVSLANYLTAGLLNGASTDGNPSYTVRRNFFENTRYEALRLRGNNCVVEDNTFWGCITGALQGRMVGFRLARNTYNKCGVAIQHSENVAIDVIDEDSVFGDIAANTLDIVYAAGNYCSPWLHRRTLGATVTDANLVYQTPGSRIAYESFGGVVGDDITHYYSGKIQRCNAATSDTTVHTAGGSSMRFEPILPGTLFAFPFDIPTGDISTKLMSVAVWCKVNNTDYYAGTHQMPRLCVSYDAGATTIYADAVQGTTDWQLLQVSFTPTTSAGKIVVTLSGDTDAIGTDRYFYFDDFSILYPAGTSLDLSGIDLWQDALPVLPPIATGLSVAGVWTAPSNVSYGADTMGTKLIDAETKADDACALIVSK